ncbi:DUF3325 domain-containing protein [Diaphorobacter sp. HDW4A]|uniref:DUF3325 domain-containing protein n=1 Tax=Diaphorobacter sp. HDW4A TaxID=2714924 RepID=UPI00140AA27E|nr:DUF3325 domain-containing protein [Diaphorobacter sp. HDW4A]QIL80214.1 DUF3325 domain-containing protein [Diaphorobacter sp. HDW4A]
MTMLYAGMLTLALTLGAMTALALAMDRHYEQWTGQRSVPPTRARWLRIAGVLLLLLSLLPCVQLWGGTVGCVAWLGFVSAGALLAVAGISAHARWAVRAVVLVLLAALASLARL